MWPVATGEEQTTAFHVYNAHGFQYEEELPVEQHGYLINCWETIYIILNHES